MKACALPWSNGPFPARAEKEQGRSPPSALCRAAFSGKKGLLNPEIPMTDKLQDHTLIHCRENRSCRLCSTCLAGRRSQVQSSASPVKGSHVENSDGILKNSCQSEKIIPGWIHGLIPSVQLEPARPYVFSRLTANAAQKQNRQAFCQDFSPASIPPMSTCLCTWRSLHITYRSRFPWLSMRRRSFPPIGETL